VAVEEVEKLLQALSASALGVVCERTERTEGKRWGRHVTVGRAREVLSPSTVESVEKEGEVEGWGEEERGRTRKGGRGRREEEENKDKGRWLLQQWRKGFKGRKTNDWSIVANHQSLFSSHSVSFLSFCRKLDVASQNRPFFSWSCSSISLT